MTQFFLISGKLVRRFLFSALILAAPVLAADQPSEKDAALPSADAQASDKTPRAAANDGLQSSVVYLVLLAEVSLQRGEVGMASAIYADLALRTRDPGIMERAIIISGLARRFSRAQDIAQLWLDVDPESKRAQELLVRLMIHSRRPEELAPHIINLFGQDKSTLPGNILGLNKMFADNPDRRAVFRLIERVCASFPDIPEAHYTLAIAAESSGDPERAFSEAREALTLRPEWEMPVLFQARLLARKVTKEDAIDLLQDFVENFPQARDSRLFLARMLIGKENYLQARRHLEHLIESYPDDPEIIFPLAILGLQLGDLPMAETRLKHLLTLPVSDRSHAHYYLGNIAERGKRIDEALEHYAQVTRGESRFPAQLRRARLLIAQGKPDEARRHLNALDATTDEEQTQLALAQADLLRETRQNKAAFDLLDGLLATRPNHAELLYETALLAEKIGQMEILEERMRKLIVLRPDNAQAYNVLGYSLADRNLRLPEARELIEKALTLSEEGHILDSMGWVLFRQGDFQGALTYLERALKQLDDPEIVVHMSEALVALERKDEAQQILRDAGERFPDSEILRNAIKRLFP